MAFLGVRACDLAALAHPRRRPDRGSLRRRGLRRPAAARPSSWPSSAPVPPAPASAPRWAPGPRSRSGFDIGAHRARRRAIVAAAGSEAGQKLVDRLALARRPRSQLHAAAGVGSRRARRWPSSPASPPQGLQGPAPWRQLESDGWERDRRALPRLHELHDGLSDLLLQRRPQTDRPGRPRPTVERASGTPASPSTSPASPHGNFRPRVSDRYRQWLTHKFSTWVDQFGTLRLRGLRPLHHLVPGGHRRARVDAPAWRPCSRHLQRSEKPVPVSANPGRSTPRHHRRGLGRDEERLDDAPRRDLPEAVWRRAAGPVPHARPAGLLGRAHLHLALPRGRGRPDHPRRGRQHARHHRRCRPGRRSACAGPSADGWPLEEAFGRDVVIVAGGIGLPPLRPLIDEILAHRERFGRVRALLRRAHTGRPALRRGAEVLGGARRHERGRHRRPRQGRDLERAGRRGDPALRP